MEDALARRAEERRGSTAWAEALRELGAMDRAVYQAMADTPSPRLDGVFRRLSTAADHSRVIKPEGSSDFFREAVQQSGIMSHWKGPHIPRPCRQRKHRP